MKKKSKFHMIFWSCFTVLCLSFLGILSFWALSPSMDSLTDSMCVIVNPKDAVTEWTTIDNWHIYGANGSDETTDEIEYGGILSEKTAMLSSLNGSDVDIRFIDEDGNIAIDSVTLTPQKGSEQQADLSELKSNKKYTVQYRCSKGGDYAINLH